MKKIAKMNIAKSSQKNLALKNIWKAASFIKKQLPTWDGPKWFQLFVYFFGKKIFFSERLPQLILSFFECTKVIFAILEHFY